jgi:hypothetical protein
MSDIGPGIDRLFAMKKIKDNDEQQIEHARTQHITGSDIRRLSDRDRADSVNKLRQGSNRSYHNHPDPGSGQSQFLTNHVTVKGQTVTSHRDQDQTEGKFKPDQHD